MDTSIYWEATGIFVLCLSIGVASLYLLNKLDQRSREKQIKKISRRKDK
jgi:CHASE3 domain sensor protein